MQGKIAQKRRNWYGAIEHYRTALRLRRRGGNSRLIAWSLVDLGTALSLVEDYNEAIDCFEEASAVLETMVDPLHQAIAQMNIGTVQLKNAKPYEAIRWYRLAVQTFLDCQDSYSLAQIYNNFGLAYSDLRAWDEAEKSLETSVQFWQKVNECSSLVNSIDSLGVVLMCWGKYTAARHQFQRARGLLGRLRGSPDYTRLNSLLTKHEAELADLEKKGR